MLLKFVLQTVKQLCKTKCSENDNTPQPLDQWSNSPFLGQQVGNCKSFTLTHDLSDLFAMHQGQSHCASNIIWVRSRNCGCLVTWFCYQLTAKPGKKIATVSWPDPYTTHTPFIPSESTLPFLSYSNFNILPSKFKVKVMGEVKVWSHNVSPTFYRPKSLLFHVNRPSHSWYMTFSKFDLENPRSMSWKRWTLKVITWIQHGRGEHWKSQNGSNIPSTHIPFVPCESTIPFIRYDFFKIWSWKSKVKVMGEENVESHKVGVTSYRLTILSFHVNRPYRSWYSIFKIWPWKSMVNVKWPWCCTTTGLDKSIKL